MELRTLNKVHTNQTSPMLSESLVLETAETKQLYPALVSLMRLHYSLVIPIRGSSLHLFEIENHCSRNISLRSKPKHVFYGSIRFIFVRETNITVHAMQ